MSEIETKDELHAVQAAYDATTDGGATARQAFREGWIAGRDWAREQQARQPAAEGSRPS